MGNLVNMCHSQLHRVICCKDMDKYWWMIYRCCILTLFGHCWAFTHKKQCSCRLLSYVLWLNNWLDCQCDAFNEHLRERTAHVVPDRSVSTRTWGGWRSCIMSCLRITSCMNANVFWYQMNSNGKVLFLSKIFIFFFAKLTLICVCPESAETCSFFRFSTEGGDPCTQNNNKDLNIHWES